MKKAILALAGIGLLVPGIVWAGFDLPKKVYKASQFEQAKTAATAAGKPISVILSDTGTTCPLACNASLVMINSLDRKTVIVYANPRDGLDALPALVREALSKPEAGTFIPRTVVVDADVSKVICIVPYGEPEALQDSLNKARKAILKMPSAKTSKSSLRSTGGAAKKTAKETAPAPAP